MSPRSTTLPLHFWNFGSNPEFLTRHRSINDAKWTFLPFIPCFINHFFLVSDFRQLHMPGFSPVFPILLPLLPVHLESLVLEASEFKPWSRAFVGINNTNIHDFCGCHLGRWRSLFSARCVRTWIIFYNVTSEYNSTFVFLTSRVQLRVLKMISIRQRREMNFSSLIPCFRLWSSGSLPASLARTPGRTRGDHLAASRQTSSWSHYFFGHGDARSKRSHDSTRKKSK